MDNIHWTNQEIFHKNKPHHPKAAAWWNPACSIATQKMYAAQGTATKATAQVRLKGTVRVAQRRWANDYIEKAQLWKVAGWRHGCRLTKVLSLQGPEGIVHTHEGVADILSQRFFTQTPPMVNVFFPNDPPPCPTQMLPPIDEEFVRALLQKVASKSTPGQSGHTWTILKWVWAAGTKVLFELIAACLKARHHPWQWKEAVVYIIPKPKHTDYTLAKNFRLISLLKCLGKLLEKVVTKMIYKKMEKHALIPNNQFGGQNASGDMCRHHGWVCGCNWQCFNLRQNI